MVMATPSPQQVGREFVRQYYTVLHEAPDVLHRFYSSGSTFVHGGVDRPGLTEEPVVGQLEIDKKIKLLSFKDCHTKIRQVDSQSTIGNGVVVQVNKLFILFLGERDVVKTCCLHLQGDWRVVKQWRAYATLHADICVGAADTQKILRSQRHIPLPG